MFHIFIFISQTDWKWIIPLYNLHIFPNLGHFSLTNTCSYPPNLHFVNFFCWFTWDTLEETVCTLWEILTMLKQEIISCCSIKFYHISRDIFPRWSCYSILDLSDVWYIPSINLISINTSSILWSPWPSLSQYPDPWWKQGKNFKNIFRWFLTKGDKSCSFSKDQLLFRSHIVHNSFMYLIETHVF